MRRVWSAIAGVVLCLIPALGMAQEGVPGADDPALEAAIEAWLAGEDLPAIEAFARLSKEGNTAAQMLLSGIYFTTSQLTPALKYRDAAGLVGPTIDGEVRPAREWLDVAASDFALARQISSFEKAVWGGDEEWIDAAVMGAFVRAGESSYAAYIAYALWNSHFTTAPLAVLQSMGRDVPVEIIPIVQSDLDHLLRLTAQDAAWVDAYLSDLAKRFDASDIRAASLRWSRRRPTFDPSQTSGLPLADLKAVPGWTPVLRFCEKNCAADVAECASEAIDRMMLSPFVLLSSPRESVLPSPRYWRSARAVADLVRYGAGMRADPFKVFGDSPAAQMCFLQSMSAAIALVDDQALRGWQ